ncbi:hypothetical protein H4219_005932 [Mycoemilia scoparia]|uniref:Uncharacterized protein n=1 Tax=Mycoemilia scoparia TaxID=417184 RepID=A0A9W8DN79_9FUNG|nr:hypothetical protein H4219_005932 [Mycoemilia scoparia]
MEGTQNSSASTSADTTSSYLDVDGYYSIQEITPDGQSFGGSFQLHFNNDTKDKVEATVRQFIEFSNGVIVLSDSEVSLNVDCTANDDDATMQQKRRLFFVYLGEGHVCLGGPEIRVKL